MTKSSRADIFVNFDEHFHVGEAADLEPSAAPKIGGDRLGERAIGVAGQNLHFAEHGRFSKRVRGTASGPRTRRVIAAGPRPNNMTA